MAPARPSPPRSHRATRPTSLPEEQVIQAELPGAERGTPTALTARTRLYSQPSLTMKKPFGAVHRPGRDEHQRDETRGRDRVSNPTARPRPAAISVVAAMRGVKLTGLHPDALEPAAVPAIRPPPKNLFNRVRPSSGPAPTAGSAIRHHGTCHMKS